MSKILYIIPGFTEQTEMESYQRIIKVAQANGFQTIPVKIQWHRKTMNDYVQQFIAQVDQKKNDQLYFFGFSFGAMIALIANTTIKPKAQILCSLSPYFKEDLSGVKQSWKKIVGKNRIDNFKKTSFTELSKKITAKTFLLIGSEESEIIHKRIKDAKEKIKNSKLVVVPQSKHDIATETYFQEIKKTIQLLK